MLSMRDEIQKYHDRKHAENSQQKSHPIEEMESTYPAHTKNKGEPVYQHDLHKKEGQNDQAQLQPIDHRFPKSWRLKEHGRTVLRWQKIENNHQIIPEHQTAVHVE